MTKTNRPKIVLNRMSGIIRGNPYGFTFYTKRQREFLECQLNPFVPFTWTLPSSHVLYHYISIPDLTNSNDLLCL